MSNPFPLPKERLLEAYRKMRTIRDFEERLHVDFSRGEIPGFVHLYAGEETTAVGIMAHLHDRDRIASTHRGHGHCIAKGVDVRVSPEDVQSSGVPIDVVDQLAAMDGVRAVAPAISGFLVLLNDDGEVVEYLNPANWTGQTRDGSRGQVMVELPMHYRKFETDGTKRRVRISEYPLHGYRLVPGNRYVSAYQATIQRSTTTLCSVVNMDADYRGGNNDSTLDNTNRTMLGKAATNQIPSPTNQFITAIVLLN